MQQHPGTAEGASRRRAARPRRAGSASRRRRRRARPDRGATARRPTIGGAAGQRRDDEVGPQRDRIDVEIGDDQIDAERSRRGRQPLGARRSRTSVVQRATPSSTSAPSTAWAVPPAPSTVTDPTATALSRTVATTPATSVLSAIQPPPVRGSNVFACTDRGGDRPHLVRELEHGVLERHRAREAGPVGALGEHGRQLVHTAVDRVVLPVQPERFVRGGVQHRRQRVRDRSSEHGRGGAQGQPQPQWFFTHLVTAAVKAFSLFVKNR